jgi:hypothetical protein
MLQKLNFDKSPDFLKSCETLCKEIEKQHLTQDIAKTIVELKDSTLNPSFECEYDEKTGTFKMPKIDNSIIPPNFTNVYSSKKQTPNIKNADKKPAWRYGGNA